MVKTHPSFYARVGKITDIADTSEGQQKAKAMAMAHNVNRSTELYNELQTKHVHKILMTNDESQPKKAGTSKDETSVVECLFTRIAIERIKEALAIAIREYKRRPDDPSARAMVAEFQALTDDIVLIREVVNP